MNHTHYIKTLLTGLAIDCVDEDGAREVATQAAVEDCELSWEEAEDLVGAVMAKHWDDIVAEAEETNRNARDFALEISETSRGNY